MWVRLIESSFFWEYIPKFYPCQEKNESRDDIFVADLWQSETTNSWGYDGWPIEGAEATSDGAR